jgi:hypothetical protein
MINTDTQPGQYIPVPYRLFLRQLVPYVTLQNAFPNTDLHERRDQDIAVTSVADPDPRSGAY